MLGTSTCWRSRRGREADMLQRLTYWFGARRTASRREPLREVLDHLEARIVLAPF